MTLKMRQRYPDDLTDKEWNLIEPLFTTDRTKGGRPPKHSRREILNAIFYVLRTGCQWRSLPHDLPPWRAVYVQYARWREKNLFEKMNDYLRRSLRELLGRKADPSAGIVDSQSIKTTEKGALQVMTPIKKLKAENVIYLLTLKG